jgi:copper chaperone CopZ
MKTVKMFLAAMIMVVISSASFAQTGKTKSESIKVLGNCGTCKTTIEKAARITGVSKAEWSENSKTLAVVYDPSKVNSETIQKKVAAAGYDTEKFKGDDKAYAQLPGCCKYKRK